MTLDRPLWFVAGIAAVALFAFLYVRAETRKSANDLAYSDLAFFESEVRPRAWIPGLLRGAAIAALFLAAIGIAGPQLLLPVPARDGETFICIDTSGSMQSTDVAPTRAEAAKAAARAFMDAAPEGTKIGVIAFSSSAAIVAPLSPDRNAARAALDDIPAPNGATAIGDALQLAAQHFSPRGHRVVILITDGVNNAGVDPQELATYLGAHHIPVYTVGIGTNNGDVIPGTGEQATIDDDALRAYAQASGGAYARAENATQLRDALSHLGRVTSFERRRVAAGSGFIIAGFCVLFCCMLSGLALGRYP
ncbi:MAG: VWA domain-containing protein [Candidatus Baltobacteraceae bacterium]